MCPDRHSHPLSQSSSLIMDINFVFCIMKEERVSFKSRSLCKVPHQYTESIGFFLSILSTKFGSASPPHVHFTRNIIVIWLARCPTLNNVNVLNSISAEWWPIVSNVSQFVIRAECAVVSDILAIRMRNFHSFRCTRHSIPCATEANTRRSILIAFQVREWRKSSTNRTTEKKLVRSRAHIFALTFTCIHRLALLCYFYVRRFDSETLTHRIYVVCIGPHSINLCGNGNECRERPRID